MAGTTINITGRMAVHGRIRAALGRIGVIGGKT